MLIGSHKTENTVLEIATSGFALLAMTVVIGALPEPSNC